MSCKFPLCTRHPGKSGYCIGHEKYSGVVKEPKAKLPIARVSEKKKARLKEEEAEKKTMGAWFATRRKEMKGLCLNCGGKSCKEDPKHWKYSIAHILPKNVFESMATHPLNWIELCHFDKSCHTNMDNKILEMQDMKCWPTIVERFKIMFPSIAASERKWIPDCLLQELSPSK